MGLSYSSVIQAASRMIGSPTPFGVPMQAFVEHPDLLQQKCPEWCWAASISMIFAYYEHAVDQVRIVTETFGAPVCQSSNGPIPVIANLNRQWVDDDGDGFGCRIVAGYDAFDGINAINNAFIVNELGNDRPLFYANKHHAMVVVAVEYFATPMGPDVRAVGVLDPWPYNNPGFHSLAPSEMIPASLGGDMTFLASVRIEDGT